MRNIVLCGLMMMMAIFGAGCLFGSEEIFAFGNGGIGAGINNDSAIEEIRDIQPDGEKYASRLNGERYAALPVCESFAARTVCEGVAARLNGESFAARLDCEEYVALPVCESFAARLDCEEYVALPVCESFAARLNVDDNKMLSVRPAFTSSSPTHPPAITLNSGYSMPVFGLGTWILNNSAAESAVYTAILSGYRLFDTARYYANESGVGRGVRKAIAEGIISREDVFITSKIVPAGKQDYDSLINDSNKSLGLKYIDLMLIHQSGYGDKELYKALERAVKSGTVRSIGISNYYTPEEYERITSEAEIPPAVVQNENHPYYQNTQLRKYLQPYGVFIESWYPLGGRGHTQDLFSNEIIARIAKNHSKSPAQVIIRWHIQAGYIVIPGSKNPKHIRENIDVFDFELTDEEMKAIQNLNHNHRFENW